MTALQELRLRIVHVIPKFSRSHWGGAEGALTELLPQLQQRGHRCEVWTNENPDWGVDTEADVFPVRRFKARYLSASERAKAGIGKAPMSLSMVAAVARDQSIDVLHLHTHNRMAAILALIARARRIPVILTIHSEFRHLRPRVRYWFSNELVLRLAHRVIVLTAPAARALPRGVAESRIAIVPHGVDVDFYSAGNPQIIRLQLLLGDGPVIGCFGRVCRLKNQLDLVKAFAEVVRKHPDAHLLLVGPASEPDYLDRIHEFVERVGITRAVHYLEGVEPKSRSLVDAYAACSVVAVPSWSEALPLVVMEAWAAARPVIASRRGGVPFLVQEDGLLVDPAEGPPGWARAIEAVLRDPELHARLSVGGKRRAVEMTWSRIAEQHVDLYVNTFLGRSW